MPFRVVKVRTEEEIESALERFEPLIKHWQVIYLPTGEFLVVVQLYKEPE